MNELMKVILPSFSSFASTMHIYYFYMSHWYRLFGVQILQALSRRATHRRVMEIRVFYIHHYACSTEDTIQWWVVSTISFQDVFSKASSLLNLALIFDLMNNITHYLYRDIYLKFIYFICLNYLCIL